MDKGEKMTNFEYIKSLDIDELIRCMQKQIYCDSCPIQEGCSESPLECTGELEKWLNEEHKND